MPDPHLNHDRGVTERDEARLGWQSGNEYFGLFLMTWEVAYALSALAVCPGGYPGGRSDHDQ